MKMSTYIAIGVGVWGRGKTPQEAKRKMRQAGRTPRWLVYRCEDDDAYVANDGCLCTKSDTPPPEEIERWLPRS